MQGTGCLERNSDSFFAHSSASKAPSNKVEGIFEQPIPWAVEKYTKTYCLSKNWPRNLQISLD